MQKMKKLKTNKMKKMKMMKTTKQKGSGHTRMKQMTRRQRRTKMKKKNMMTREALWKRRRRKKKREGVMMLRRRKLRTGRLVQAIRTTMMVARNRTTSEQRTVMKGNWKMTRNVDGERTMRRGQMMMK
jgi:hypothetical protein